MHNVGIKENLDELEAKAKSLKSDETIKITIQSDDTTMDTYELVNLEKEK